MGIIYLAENKINGKCYVGKTIGTLENRKYGHVAESKRGSTSIFHKAIRKYGIENFDWMVLETLPDDDLNTAECFWISYNNFFQLPHYNLTTGGEGSPGRILSKESREKLSKSLTGRKQSIETKQKKSRAMKGRPGKSPSNETREKIRQTLLGKKSPKSKEGLENIRRGQLGRRGIPLPLELRQKLSDIKGKKYDVLLEAPDGTIYGPIVNLKKFCLEHNLNRSNLRRVFNGKYKQCTGWRLYKRN